MKRSDESNSIASDNCRSSDANSSVSAQRHIIVCTINICVDTNTDTVLSKYILIIGVPVRILPFSSSDIQMTNKIYPNTHTHTHSTNNDNDDRTETPQKPTTIITNRKQNIIKYSSIEILFRCVVNQPSISALPPKKTHKKRKFTEITKQKKANQIDNKTEVKADRNTRK